MELVKSDRYVPQSGKEIVDTVSAHQENEFQDWWGEKSATLGLDPNPDDPRHYYDYRGAYKAGINPQMKGEHFGSPFKRAGHPDRFLSLPDEGFIDTKTGKPYVPNPVSTITGKPTTMDEELKGTGERGINSNILSTLDILEGTREDPRWQMAAWQKGKDPSTKLGILKREAVLQEIKEMRKITDYAEFKKALPERIKTWTRDDRGAKGKKWYDNFFRKSETSTEDLFDYK